MIQKPDFIIVSGNGRNTGKTSFVERIIRKNCVEHSITAIKVSPHFHRSDHAGNILEANGDFRISKENDSRGSKDSSRLLRAGASTVYYIETKDEYLAEAMRFLIENENIRGPVICESGGMREYIKPSMMVLLNEAGRTELKSSYRNLLPKADHLVVLHNGEFDPDPGNIIFAGSKWEIKDT